MIAVMVLGSWFRRFGLACVQNRRANVTGTDPPSDTDPRIRIEGKLSVTIVLAGAAGWLILLLMCAYAKGRDRRA